MEIIIRNKINKLNLIKRNIKNYIIKLNIRIRT